MFMDGRVGGQTVPCHYTSVFVPSRRIEILYQYLTYFLYHLMILYIISSNKNRLIKENAYTGIIQKSIRVLSTELVLWRVSVNREIRLSTERYVMSTEERLR